MSATSCLFEGRFSPVSMSFMRMPSQNVTKPTLLDPIMKSCLGSRPQNEYVGGQAASASMTTCGGIFATFLSLSMRQPASANSASAWSSST